MKEIIIFLFLLLFISNTNQIKDESKNEAKFKLGTPTCENGRIVSGKCQCPSGYRLYRGVCLQSISQSCINGKIINYKCVCPFTKKLINGICQ